MGEIQSLTEKKIDDIFDCCRWCAFVAINQGLIIPGKGIDIYSMAECPQAEHDAIIKAWNEMGMVCDDFTPLPQLKIKGFPDSGSSQAGRLPKARQKMSTE